MYFKTLAGTFTKQTDGSLRATIDASQSARAVRGNETDKDYEFYAKVTITTGKVAVIVNFTYDSSLLEYYVEMILDSTLNKVTLDSVIRNADGTENTRTNLDSRDMTINTATQYSIRIISKEISTDVYGVYGYLDGMMVVQEENLTTNFQIGMHGLECLGSAEQYSDYDEMFLQEMSYYTLLDSLLNEIRSIAKKELVGNDGTDQDYYDKIATYILEASRFIDSECQRDQNFFQRGGIELTEYHDGSGSSPPKGMYDFAESEEAWQDRAATIFTGQRPILSITNINENLASIGETDNWRAITAFRWFKHGEITFGSSAIPPEGKKNVRIIYKVGYSETPLDIQLACTRLIVNLIHKQVSDRTEAYQSFTRPTAINFAMPDIYTPDIKAVLARYKLTDFGEM